MTPELITIIENTARDFMLPRNLILAIVAIESGGNTWAWNPEPRYRYLWDMRAQKPFRFLTPAETESEEPPADFPSLAGDRDQEWWGQQASWGLMQVMGGVARENGFAQPYLTSLCDPRFNLTIGCQHLKKIATLTKGDVTQMLAIWNGGPQGNMKMPYRNLTYAQKIESLLV